MLTDMNMENQKISYHSPRNQQTSCDNNLSESESLYHWRIQQNTSVKENDEKQMRCFITSGILLLFLIMGWYILFLRNTNQQYYQALQERLNEPFRPQKPDNIKSKSIQVQHINATSKPSSQGLQIVQSATTYTSSINNSSETQIAHNISLNMYNDLLVRIKTLEKTVSVTSNQKKAFLREIQVKRKNQNMLYKQLDGAYIQFEHSFDPTLMQLLEGFYKAKKAKTILDIGCGKCEYIIRLHELGFKAEGVDGYPEIKHDIISKKDLSRPIRLNKQFDFVESFEVGEHIFSSFENNFLENIARHARKGIVISWSVLGQVGFMHVNNRDNSYIINKLEKLGFIYNLKQSNNFRRKFKNYLSHSLMIFYRK